MIQWLTDTLLMTGLLMVLVLVIRRPVGRWFGAGAAYALWTLPMIRLVLPPLALPPGLLPWVEFGAAPTTDASPIASALPAEAMPAAFAPVADGAGFVSAGDPGILAQVPWTALFLAIWLGGAAVFLAARVAGYRAMRRELLRDARLVARAGEVRIVESPAAAAPLAFGVTEKFVALPSGFLATVDSESSDYAIAHELEHHRGSDLLVLFAMQPLFALHWFNPLAWAAWRALRSDQEAACDVRVMAGLGGEERARYGRLIASFAAGPRLALIAPMAGPLSGEKPIIHRLRALARGEVSPARHALARGLFAFGVIALPATATVTYAAVEESEGTAPAVPAPPVPPVPPVAPVPSMHAEPRSPAPVAEVPDAPEPPAAPAWHRSQANPVAIPAPPAPPAPLAAPAPPVPPAAPAFRTSWNEHPIRHADALRRAEQSARMAKEAIARAPRVEEFLSADGNRKTMRIVSSNADGQRASVYEMVLDHSCPADDHRPEPDAGRGGKQVVICTGVPRVAAAATVDAISSARRSIAAEHALDAAIRAEILADLDQELAEARREMAASRE